MILLNKEFTISYDPCGIRDIENCIMENIPLVKQILYIEIFRKY